MGLLKDMSREKLTLWMMSAEWIYCRGKEKKCYCEYLDGSTEQLFSYFEFNFCSHRSGGKNRQFHDTVDKERAVL